jgi:protoporphyrin/coproporphyrin ferrochelatase
MDHEKTGVLFMAYGAASSLEEVEPYLADIRAGRPPNPELVEEVKQRYRLMGGRSPLLDITTQQAKALEDSLNQGEGQNQAHHFKVYIGMRHWHPYIKDTMAVMAKDGIQKIVAICLTPYYSKMSIGAYHKKLDEALLSVDRHLEVVRVESWNDHPLFVEAVAENLQETLSGFEESARKKVAILFSAHSLPARILDEKDPYPEELNKTIELVMKKVGPYRWWFGYQSQGRTPEPWLGPDAGEVIRQLYDEGYRQLVMAPIGFISDHMETLYDVDILYRKQAESLGMQFARSKSLNAAPSLIQALRAVIREHLQSSP